MTSGDIGKYLVLTKIWAGRLSGGNRYLADELVSAGLVGLAEGLARYKNDGNGKQAFIVRNIRGRMLDHLRSGDGMRPFARNARQQDRPGFVPMESEIVDTMIDQGPTPAEVYQRNREREEFERVLDDRETVVFRLYFFGDLSMREVATSLDLTWNEVNETVMGIKTKILASGLVEGGRGALNP